MFILQYEGVQYIKITPSLGVLYPGIDHLRGFINKIAIEYNYVNYIMIESSKIVSLDYTAIKVSDLLYQRRTYFKMILGHRKYCHRFKNPGSRDNFL